MMATGFLGYVLPWGQMSFWAATVITNLFSAIPYIGQSIVELLWGGFSVDNPTLNRFYSLHFTVPFLIAGLAILHLILLHEYGSGNPLGIDTVIEKIPFLSYFIIKDIFFLFLAIILLAFLIVNVPDMLGHPDNYIEAQPLVTPAHIVPEWYFLPYYAILRCIPDKLSGVIAMFWSLLILFSAPWLDSSPFRSSLFKPFSAYMFIFFMYIVITLGWLGQEIVDFPFLQFSAVVSFLYFMYFKSLTLDGIL
jgi:ubiquinol-cytochrome c reductase cytochrome b subunit